MGVFTSSVGGAYLAWLLRRPPGPLVTATDPQFQWKSKVRFPLKLRKLSTGVGVSWGDAPVVRNFH
ncbi:hypothetical protein AB0H34_04700 [Saccharopolyspora shandongensis]|uniref:hypothetical protein n=1 Tax=Saccharopolyspora shandongensis TaxID=418495 RepID=UPI0033F2FE55